VVGKIAWIWNVWRPIFRWFWVLLALTMISTAVAVAYPMLLGMLLDALRDARDAAEDGSALISVAEWMVWALVGVAVLRLLAALYPGARAFLNLKIDRNVRETYFGYILRKGYRFFLRFRTGDLVTRLTDDIAEFPKIAWFCCSGIFRAVESSSKLLFCVIAMMVIEPRLTVLAVMPLPVMIIIFVIAHRELGKRVERERRARSATNDVLEASFAGVSIVKAYNAEERQTVALQRVLTDRIDAEMRVVRTWQLINVIYMGLNFGGQIIVVAVGGMLVLNDALTIGSFVALFLYLQMLVEPILDVPNLFVTGRQAFVCIDREEQIRLYDRDGEGGAFSELGREQARLGYMPELAQIQERLAAEDREAARRRDREAVEPVSTSHLRFESLQFRNVQFAFPVMPNTRDDDERNEEGRYIKPILFDEEVTFGRPVLSGVNLDLRRGQRLAVVGRLGSGKSTLIGLAAGRLVPQTGRVLVNDAPLHSFRPADFSHMVAVVPQDPVLFSESVRENIVFGRPFDEELLHEVVDAVGLTAEIAAMPKGFDQQVGQRGVTLSGGQRQRLTIARALYGRPQLLLLDDLTSALDAHNEDRLWRRLARMVPDASLLVVTHRIATARAMDRIVVIDNGMIAAQGTHDELIDESPMYRNFQHNFGEDAQAPPAQPTEPPTAAASPSGRFPGA
jgi:ABC-type multidrug transport system fused ATPase/permease subunit